MSKFSSLGYTAVIPIVTGLFVLFSVSAVYAHADHKKKTEAPQILAPGYHVLDFEPPVPGRYQLANLGAAGNGRVLDTEGRPQQLHDLFGEKIVALSFIYTHCDDVNGCPLATYVFSTVQNRLVKEDELRDEIRFISLSFDPKQDTPKVMANYGLNYIKENFDWHFLTTRSKSELDPILSLFNQSIQEDIDENGNSLGTISHILRVFLIDKQKNIRNIYSTSFLHADTVVNDIKTLLLEERQTGNTRQTNKIALQRLHGAGDNKDDYEKPNYVTRSRSLTQRIGKNTNLMQDLIHPPLGLPQLPVPDNNPLTLGKVELGKKLFYDRRLSHNNTISCAMCHIPEQGFTNNELATAVGIEGRTVRRNSPSLYNVAYLERLFHDARENSLEQQVWSPLLDKNEMANPSIGVVIEKIRSYPDYRGRFEQVFDKGPTMETIGMAIASYQRTLISANSPFDRWYYNKEQKAISQSAARGYGLFSGKAQCIACHSISTNYALFTNNKLHNTGIGYQNSMQVAPRKNKVLLAPGTYITIDMAAIKDSSEAKPNDLGLYEITENPADRWKYRTPSLRNVALSAPYMHDGSLPTLKEVISFYNKGGVPSELLDPLIRPLNLSAEEIQDLENFLHSLTGDNIDKILSDAFAAPTGNIKSAH